MKALPLVAISFVSICHAERVYTQAQFEASPVFKSLGLKPQMAKKGPNGWGVNYMTKIGSAKKDNLDIYLHLVESPYRDSTVPVINSMIVRLDKEGPIYLHEEDSKEATTRRNALEALVDLEKPSHFYKFKIMEAIERAEGSTEEDSFDKDVDLA